MGLDMKGFVLQTEKILVACVKEVMETTNETFLVAGVRAEGENLFASNSCLVSWVNDNRVVDGDGGVVFAENIRFEVDGRLLSSTKFCDGGHGGCLKLMTT